MIEESYVSLETAKLLKEVGFREHSRCMYYEEKDGSYKLYKCLIGDYDVSTDKSYEGDLYGERYLAPTQALAARWLREVYNVAIYSLYDDDMEQCFYVVDAFMKNPMINVFQSGSEYDDYESAFEDGLREAIKLIKK